MKLVLDVNSGAVHILDDISYDILKGAKTINDMYRAAESLRQSYKESDISEAIGELESLVNEGSLFSDEPDMEVIHERTDFKALCLHIAHDCNLRCKYCFAGKGTYTGGKKELMPLDIALNAVDFLLSNSSLKNVEIDFFGGEPFLNFDVVKKTVEYAKKRQGNRTVHFTITTNATILDDEILKFINKNMDNVVLSLDGRKSVHDNMRSYSNGRGSYDKVLENITKVVDDRKGKSYFIRGTFTKDNLDFSSDIKHIARLGFKEISIEPVTGKDFEFTEEEVEMILAEYEDFAHEYALQEDYRFYHFNVELYHGPCIFKRIRSCGAGFEYASVTPDGSLYACHQFAGIDEFKLGSVQRGVENTELVNRMRSSNVLTKEACKDCWAKYFCSGGCHALAYFKNNDIGVPDDTSCKLQKKRIECALIIEAIRNSGGI